MARGNQKEKAREKNLAAQSAMVCLPPHDELDGLERHTDSPTTEEEEQRPLI